MPFIIFPLYYVCSAWVNKYLWMKERVNESVITVSSRTSRSHEDSISCWRVNRRRKEIFLLSKEKRQFSKVCKTTFLSPRIENRKCWDFFGIASMIHVYLLFSIYSPMVLNRKIGDNNIIPAMEVLVPNLELVWLYKTHDNCLKCLLGSWRDGLVVAGSLLLL